MRRLIFIVVLLIISLCTVGQTDSTKYYFSEIGMTIYVSNDFKIQEPLARPPQYLDADLKPITDSTIIKQMTKDDPKDLIAIESLDREDE